MYHVYVLENPSEKIYIGFTENLERRISSHNSDFKSDWTQGKGPWRLIHTEKYADKKAASLREKNLKKLKAGQRIKKILHISDLDR